MSLTVAHRSQGDNGHVDRIEKIPVLHQHEAARTYENEGSEPQEVEEKSSCWSFFYLHRDSKFE